ncbi:unnamed protein product [Amaranthus hypochondriacus]
MEKCMAKRYTGKVAIITASTQGIGLCIAERLGTEGASVVISSRKKKNVDEAVEKLKSKGIKVLGVVCHVANAEQRKYMIDQTIQEFGKIDVIISNAAVNPTPDSILNTQESALDKLWEVNLKAPVLLIQEAAPHLTKGSAIIFISSITAYKPMPLMGMYGVTKTALHGLTKALATELAPDSRVNCIAPGYIPTHFAGIITNSDPIRQIFEEEVLLDRFGSTHDIADAAAFLGSYEASYITGETLVVAGGMNPRL